MDPVSQPGTAKTRPKRWVLTLVIALGLLFLCVGLCVLFAVKVAGSLGWFGPERDGLIVTISEETTHITQPLDEDGYVDYFAALNQRSCQGVAPEDNAAVLLGQAIGPVQLLGRCGEEARRSCVRDLGVSPPLPEEGNYFIFLYDYGKELEEAGPPALRRESKEQTPGEEDPRPNTWWALLDEQRDQASERPWSREEFPELAEWLDRNEASLRLAVDGSRKERFYAPFVRPKESLLLFNALLPAAYRCCEVCQALSIRAMLHLHEGNIEEARQDLLACHRWARLVGQGPFSLEALAAYGIDGTANSGDAVVAHHGNLTSDEIRRYRADLEKLGPLPKMVEKIDVAERYQFLDMIVAVARGGPAVLDSSDGLEDQLVELVWERCGHRLYAWDTILRMGNRRFDQAVEAARIADRLKRAEAIQKLEEEIGDEAEAATDLKSLPKSFLSKGPRKAVAERFGQMFPALFLSRLSTTLTSEDRAMATSRLADTALALAAYRADCGGYPERLAQLVPKYVDEVPSDVFTDDELRYAPFEDDYLLYSVGPNGEDDEGRTSDSEPARDDVVIRTAPIE